MAIAVATNTVCLACHHELGGSYDPAVIVAESGTEPCYLCGQPCGAESARYLAAEAANRAARAALRTAEAAEALRAWQASAAGQADAAERAAEALLVAARRQENAAFRAAASAYPSRRVEYDSARNMQVTVGRDYAADCQQGGCLTRLPWTEEEVASVKYSSLQGYHGVGPDRWCRTYRCPRCGLADDRRERIVAPNTGLS